MLGGPGSGETRWADLGEPHQRHESGDESLEGDVSTDWMTVECFLQLRRIDASDAADEREQRQCERRNVDEIELVERREQCVRGIRMEKVAGDTEPDDIALQ